jgi:hypothetical protein
MHFGVRTTATTIATTAPGAPVTIVPVPNATYTMHASGTVAGATTDSGHQLLDPNVDHASLELPAPPSLDATTIPGGVLSADGEGVREHVLVAASGARYRAVATSRGVALADLARLGAAPPSGTYSWTVQHWPRLADVEGLGGSDARAVPRSATSAPITVRIP